MTALAPPIDIKQLLAYASKHFETYSYINGNGIAYPHEAFPELLGMGAIELLNITSSHNFSWEKLDQFLAQHQGKYILGYFNYQLKNHIERLDCSITDTLQFPLVQLYVPQYIFTKKDGVWKGWDNPSELLLSSIHKDTIPPSSVNEASEAQEQFSHDQYISIVERIKKELKQGNIYEINFCNRYTGHYKHIEYDTLYQRLNAISPMPFSALHKHQEHVVVSASPERFIKRIGNIITSQPIKGTAARKSNKDEDLAQKMYLETSTKERTENIMIVDLVRNDLSKICEGGTVHVEELCKAYTFEKVHQLISTINGSLEDADTPLSSILKALFPMGSMTGAPKLKAMQLIEELEQEGRGLFSGTLGYVDPNGDFDFNVIIRSLLLNEKLGQYQYHAGSAITIASDAEQEYQECSLKTLPIRLLIKELVNRKQ